MVDAFFPRFMRFRRKSAKKPLFKLPNKDITLKPNLREQVFMVKVCLFMKPTLKTFLFVAQVNA